MAEEKKRRKAAAPREPEAVEVPAEMAESVLPRMTKARMQEGVVVPLKPIAVGLAAAALAGGVKETSLFEAISTGRLPAKKWNGRTLILLRDLEKFLYSLPARPITRAARPSPVTEENAG
jgi:hypothetical protein